MRPRPGGQAKEGPRLPALVAGLGASAGGLEALGQLFSHLPARPGLSFVVVQHLAPDHRSMLVELLARTTSMAVLEAADAMQPQADHVYVIAPGTLLTLEGGVFRVTAAAAPGTREPIDAFFRSLAEDRGERAVGIVLSGAGYDGTAGLRAIKERGGLTLAQSPETASRDDMPRSAIEAGAADHVLSPGQLAAKLLEHAGYLGDAERAGAAALDEELSDRLGEVCALLRKQTGHDFSSYKEGTLLRRIRRRLQVLHLATVGDYLRALAEDATEATALVKDLLIGVTQFFRDPYAFLALAQQVVPRIVQKAPDAPVRIWVPGCASGEEVYSIAILVREHLERLGTRRPVQIFATDLDAEMLAEGRRGRYPLSIAEHVSPERLARFFTRERQGYEIAKELRELCVFSQHSLIRDPPFSQLDLVSCRNVLIYLGGELQKKLVPLFHYALRPGGFLFLGPSEGIAQSPELFEAVDKKSKIFRRKETVTRPLVEFPLAARTPVSASPTPAAPGPAEPVAQAPRERLGAAFERMVLEEYAAPCAVVDERGEIVLVAGPVARFLQLPAGALTSNLLDAVRGSLRIELRAALHAASRTGRRIVREHVSVETEDAPRMVRLVVRPMPAADPSAHLFVVVLQERAPAEAISVEAAASAAELESPAVQQLEDELRSTRAELKTTVEALESANEELKSSNEELISTNEELQSANEELQTSKEELQSLNEELETVNAELRSKVEELASANSDLQNLFASTDIATLFLDRELRIARFTPAASTLFHLLETDVGRPIADLAPRFVGQDLVADARDVLRTLTPIERHVHAAQGAGWSILRVVPYRTVENRIAGVVVTFVDITALKLAEESLRESEERLSRSQEIAHLGSWELDLERNRLIWSDEVYRIFGLAPQEFGASYEAFLEAVHPDDRAAVNAAYSGSVREGKDEYEITHRVVRRSTGEIRIVHEKCRHVRDPRGRIVKSVGMVHDVTERRRAEEAVERSRQGLSRLAEASLSVMARTDLEGMLQAIAEAALVLTGARMAVCGHGLVSGQLIVGGSARVPGAPACAPGNMFRLDKGGVHMALIEGPASIRLTDAQLRSDARWWGLPGEHVPLRGLLGVRMVSRSGRVDGMILVTDKEQGDFSEHDESLLEQLATVASLALQHVEARISLEGADRHKNEFLAMLSHELRNPLAPIRSSLQILDHAAPGGGQARRAHSVIDRQVAHMTRLVDELLDVTRISRGKIQLHREPLDFAGIVRRALEDHRAAFAASGLALEVAIPERSVPIDGDRTRLAQVMGNLLQNACKFTPPGGKVTVSVETNDRLGQAIARVRDTGAGIAKEMLPRMFEPFTQADTTLDRSKGGLGLGLALVRGLVHMHGGTVSVESEGLGKGAELVVRLPLHAGPVPAAEPPRGLRRSSPPRRVLVIEDNTDAAESLREVLNLVGHTVEVANSGPAGLEMAMAFRPDVVLCDIGLPGTNGYEVARAMRAEPALRTTTLVALTGYAAPDDVARARDAGFDHHLAKPVSMEELDRVFLRNGDAAS